MGLLDRVPGSDLADSVSCLRLFPIKSCQEATSDGAPITTLEVGPTGFHLGEVVDRGWVLVDSDDTFVSQRGWDQRRARKHRDDRKLAAVAVDVRHDHLHLAAGAHGEVVVPFGAVGEPRVRLRLWGDEVAATEESETSSAFFSSLLSRRVRLTKVDLRQPRWLPGTMRRDGAANRCAAADVTPMSLVSQSSLDHLHDLAGEPRGSLPLDRFRANIDIPGAAFGPFGEDRLRRVRIGDLDAHVVKAILRCPVPNIDQRTGEDSLRLATRLLVPRLGWVKGGEGRRALQAFGQALNHVCSAEPSVSVKVGDPVLPTDVGEPNLTLKHEPPG